MQLWRVGAPTKEHVGMLCVLCINILELCQSLANMYSVSNTVVPATGGHFRFGAKVAPRGRWPLVAGNGNS